MRILVTRPESQSSITRQAFSADGHDVVLEPLLTFMGIESPIPKTSFDGIALTSATALSFCNLRNQAQTPVFTTGAATMEKAKAYGFTNVRSADGGALELSKLIQEQFNGQSASVLYPSALDPAHDLFKLLKPHNIGCINWPVYKAVERSCFSDPTLNLLSNGKIDLVLLYSRRTASNFAALWEKQMSSVRTPHLLAISQNVKDALPQSLAQTCIVSTNPSELSMRQRIKDIFYQD